MTSSLIQSSLDTLKHASSMGTRRTRANSGGQLDERPTKRQACGNVQVNGQPEYPVAKIGTTTPMASVVTRSSPSSRPRERNSSEKSEPLSTPAERPLPNQQKRGQPSQQFVVGEHSSRQQQRKQTNSNQFEDKTKQTNPMDESSIRPVDEAVHSVNTDGSYPIPSPSPSQNGPNEHDKHSFNDQMPNMLPPPNQQMINQLIHQMIPPHLLSFYHPSFSLLGMPPPSHLLPPTLLAPLGYPSPYSLSNVSPPLGPIGIPTDSNVLVPNLITPSPNSSKSYVPSESFTCPNSTPSPNAHQVQESIPSSSYPSDPKYTPCNGHPSADVGEQYSNAFKNYDVLFSIFSRIFFPRCIKTSPE